SMGVPHLRTLLQHLGTITAAGAATLPDAELLQRWAGQRDQAAFELLLWRHGPMVLRVCRRLLRQPHDVEDAFQATFLTLVRVAASIRRGEALAAWLHRVASRVALAARTAAARQARREQAAVDVPAPGSLEEVSRRDLRALLDEEIDRLPEGYRRAIILCCLE